MVYQNGTIYCIRNTITTDIYVGSTCHPLHKRMAEHKNNMNCNSCNHVKLYQKMIELGYDVFYIELYEEYPCNNNQELTKREGEVIKQIGTLNQVVAGRSKEEYYKDNFETIQQMKKVYQEKNKEYLKLKSKEWREANAEILKQKKDRYREENREAINQRKKEFYYKNKDKILAKQNEYKEQNREKVLASKRLYSAKTKDKKRDYDKEYRAKNEDIIKTSHRCEICGGQYQIKSRCQHERTKKHQHALNN